MLLGTIAVGRWRLELNGRWLMANQRRRSCGECDVLRQASPVSGPADLVLWSGGSALTSCIMSRTVHRCPCVSDTVARCGTCAGCHCVRVSAPLTALRRAPGAPGQSPESTWLCMHVCMCMGIVCGSYTAPVSDWVCGGLCGSESSAGQPMVRATDRLGLLGYVPVRCWTFSHPFLSPPPPQQTKVTIVGKNVIYIRENLVGPFLVHKIPDPPCPTPPSFNISLLRPSSLALGALQVRVLLTGMSSFCWRVSREGRVLDSAVGGQPTI